MYKCKIVDALKNEKTRCERELINAQSHVVALEDELKQPITVNKWLFLEATNPEVAQLLHMKYAILDEMATKPPITIKLQMNTIPNNAEILAKNDLSSIKRRTTAAIIIMHMITIRVIMYHFGSK